MYLSSLEGIGICGKGHMSAIERAISYGGITPHSREKTGGETQLKTVVDRIPATKVCSIWEE